MEEVLNPCACMGPVGDDPHCPCEMKRQNRPGAYEWSQAEKDELKSVLREMFMLDGQIDGYQLTKDRK